MDYLWTPWRYQYITTAGKAPECIFCAAKRDRDNDRGLLVVHRGSRNLVMLNRFPYTNSHVMVAPYEHVASLDETASTFAGTDTGQGACLNEAIMGTMRWKLRSFIVDRAVLVCLCLMLFARLSFH